MHRKSWYWEIGCDRSSILCYYMPIFQNAMARMHSMVNVHRSGIRRNVNIMVDWSITTQMLLTLFKVGQLLWTTRRSRPHIQPQCKYYGLVKHNVSKTTYKVMFCFDMLPCKAKMLSAYFTSKEISAFWLCRSVYCDPYFKSCLSHDYPANTIHIESKLD